MISARVKWPPQHPPRGALALREHGSSIANHAQSQRVKKHVLTAITGSKLRALREYVRAHKNHAVV
jgi:hypothetical protein